MEKAAADIIASMSPEAQGRAVIFLQEMAEYEKHRMDDGNMPHDLGVYCDCPECGGSGYTGGTYGGDRFCDCPAGDQAKEG